MTSLVILLDVAPAPVGVTNWGVLVLLLAVVLFLAVGFAAGLVFLLIRIKRRKLKQAEVDGSLPV